MIFIFFSSLLTLFLAGSVDVFQKPPWETPGFQPGAGIIVCVINWIQTNFLAKGRFTKNHR